MRIALLFCALFLCLHSHAEELTGRARVIDGDTIEIRGMRIRLEGIDAPESRQECERANGRRYACGQEAATKLRRRIAGRELRCVSSGRDRYGRALATCFLGKTDLNAWMVEQGQAMSYRRYSRAYIGEETSAKLGRRGIWGGRFMEPWRWRRGERLEDPPDRC